MRPLNGAILIQKPKDWTSHDVVQKARRILKLHNVGHTGTLDPMASGLMVLLVGHATKLSDFFLNGDKGYRVGIKFGVETDTWDMTGKVLSEADASGLTAELIEQKMREMLGPQPLMVPPYSAKKVNGEKLCEMARRGEETPEILKDMYFYDLKINRMTPDVEISFKCSKGSFVRSWVHFLGQKLKVGAVVSLLERTYSEPYSLERAITVDNLERDELKDGYIPMNQLLGHWPEVQVTGNEMTSVSNGQIPPLLRSRMHNLEESIESMPGIKVLTANKSLLSLVEKVNGDFKIRRVFPNI